MNEVNPKEVGIRIKSLRKKLGLSMSAFGKRIDNKVKSGTVSNWETGKNLPNNSRLKKIADIGEIDIDELLYGSLSDKIYNILIEAMIYNSDWMDSEDKYNNNPHPEYNRIANFLHAILFRTETSIEKKFKPIKELTNSEVEEYYSKVKRAKAEKIKYLTSLILKEAREVNVSISDTNSLIGICEYITGQVSSNQEYTNTGFINYVVDNVKHLIEYESLDYLFEKNDSEKERKTVSSELFDEIYNILEEATKKISKLKEKYPDIES